MKRIVTFERILCPLAQVHETDEGLQYAIALARSYRARLVVLTCVGESAPLPPNTAATMRADIKRAVEHSFVLSPSPADPAHLEWELVIAESARPAETIVREAE